MFSPVLLVVLVIVALVAATVRAVIRDDRGRLPEREGYDSRRPLP